MNDALVLAYNLETTSMTALQSICDSLGIVLKPVMPEAYGLPIGTLLGLPARPLSGTDTKPTFTDAMLVMCGLGEAQFDGFLRALRFSGIPRIDLKAMLTPTNIAWNSIRLHDELHREHEQVRRSAPRK